MLEIVGVIEELMTMIFFKGLNLNLMNYEIQILKSTLEAIEKNRD